MSTNEESLKSVVREKYARIAEQGRAENASSCCGATTPSNKVYNIMVDDYSTTEGYVEDADLGLGCGLPTQFARIKPGETVIDLGSGAGNDCFVARHEVGPEGKVIGIDFTPAMVKKLMPVMAVPARSMGIRSLMWAYMIWPALLKNPNPKNSRASGKNPTPDGSWESTVSTTSIPTSPKITTFFREPIPASDSHPQKGLPRTIPTLMRNKRLPVATGETPTTFIR